MDRAIIQVGDVIVRKFPDIQTYIDYKGEVSITDVVDIDPETLQSKISDLDDIRSGASAGSTAYQKPQSGIPSTDMDSSVQTSLGKADTALQEHQSLDGYATETYVDNHHDSTKQDVISDLSTIRNGAALGATAVQPSDIADMEVDTNKVTAWSATTTDTNYPSEKLVKDSIDEKTTTIFRTFTVTQ